MLSAGQMKRVVGVSQLFVKRKSDGALAMIIAKVTDQFLVGGDRESIRVIHV